MNKRHAPGTIVIKTPSDGIMQNMSLKRLETNQSEQQLGIIMPLDGNFEQERMI